jgi:hypothetical protein
MNIGALLQLGIVGLFVALSAWYLFGRVAPRLRSRVQQGFADWLDRPQRPQWLRTMGARSRPATTVGGGCDTGCGSCNGCGSTSGTSAPATQPIEFQRLKSRR